MVKIPFYFTNTILLLILILTFLYSIFIVYQYKDFINISSLYSTQISFFISSYFCTLLILLIGYITICTNNKTLLYIYSFYLLIPIFLFIYCIYLILNRNNSCNNQLEYYYLFKNNFSKNLNLITNNYNCCGYENQNFNLTNCNNFNLPLCTNISFNISLKICKKIILIILFLLLFLILHIFESFIRSKYLCLNKNNLESSIMNEKLF